MFPLPVIFDWRSWERGIVFHLEDRSILSPPWYEQGQLEGDEEENDGAAQLGEEDPGDNLVFHDSSFATCASFVDCHSPVLQVRDREEGSMQE